MSSYIYTAVAAMLLVYIGMSEIKKHSLNNEVEKLRSHSIELKQQNTTCNSTLSSQNKAIDSYKLDIETKQKELSEWKLKPTKVRYETIYKEVVKDNNLTGECNEVKSIINSVSNINLNSL